MRNGISSASRAIAAALLDEGQCLCSTRTRCRILEQEGESGERRDQFIHPSSRKPELLATAPNQPARSGPMDLFLSLHDDRRLQPFRHRLDGGVQGETASQ